MARLRSPLLTTLLPKGLLPGGSVTHTIGASAAQTASRSTNDANTHIATPSPRGSSQTATHGSEACASPEQHQQPACCCRRCSCLHRNNNSNDAVFFPAPPSTAAAHTRRCVPTAQAGGFGLSARAWTARALGVLTAGPAGVRLPRAYCSVGPSIRAYSIVGGTNAMQGTREGATEEAHSGERSGSETDDLRRQLDSAASEGGVPGVLQVVRQYGDRFDEASLVAAVGALSRAAAGTGGAGGSGESEWEQLEVDQTLQTLLGMVVAGAERLTAHQVAELSRSLGALHVSDQGVYDALGRSVVGGVSDMDGGDLADLVEGFAASGTTPGKVLADAVLQRIGETTSSSTSSSSSQGAQGDMGGVSGQRATADGIPLAAQQAGGAGRAAGGGGGRGVEPEAAERVRRALSEMGYVSRGKGADVPRQGQSDRAQGLDYA